MPPSTQTGTVDLLLERLMPYIEAQIPADRVDEFFDVMRRDIYSSGERYKGAESLREYINGVAIKRLKEFTEKMNPPIYCEGTSYGRRY